MTDLSVSVVSVAAPTDKQIAALTRLGSRDIPATRSEASKLIDSLIAARETAPATVAQRARASALNGRDLPGAGLREKSTQIYLLEALNLLDGATTQADVNAAAEALIARVRERFQKPGVTVAKVADESAGEAAPF